MNKRWRELAEQTVEKLKTFRYQIHTHECDADGAAMLIAQAIETAVKEERERMVVVWPSEAETMEWLNAIGRPTYGAYLDWLSTHAKVGVRE